MVDFQAVLANLHPGVLPNMPCILPLADSIDCSPEDFLYERSMMEPVPVHEDQTSIQACLELDSVCSGIRVLFMVCELCPQLRRNSLLRLCFAYSNTSMHDLILHIASGLDMQMLMSNSCAFLFYNWATYFPLYPDPNLFPFKLFGFSSFPEFACAYVDQILPMVVLLHSP